MKATYETPPEKRTYGWARAKLGALGYKLTKRCEDYAILGYNEAGDVWIGVEGDWPIPCSLTIEDVVRLTHEYAAEARIEALREDK